MGPISTRRHPGPSWGALWETPACPTSRVLGSPLTSRQRTGISMLLAPVGRWSIASTQVPG